MAIGVKVLEQLSNLDVADKNTPQQLATLLTTADDSGDSFMTLLQDLPYWNQLMDLFPAVANCLMAQEAIPELLQVSA